MGLCYHRSMMAMAQQILDEALRLPQDERLAVARTLLQSVGTRERRLESPRGMDEGAGEGSSFSQRWRGKFVAAGRADERYEALVQRYL